MFFQPRFATVVPSRICIVMPLALNAWIIQLFPKRVVVTSIFIACDIMTKESVGNFWKLGFHLENEKLSH